MSRLKEENENKCFSLLRDFIADSTMPGNKKEIAVLALTQLQRIAAGEKKDKPDDPTFRCYLRPRADA